MKKDALVIYKTKPARISEIGDKITLTLAAGENVKVREKDFELLHPGPLSDLAQLKDAALDEEAEQSIRAAWELLEGSDTELRELSEIAFGEWSAKNAYLAYLALKDGIYFTGGIEKMSPKASSEVEAEIKKRSAKAEAGAGRQAFLERLKKRETLPEDGRFMQDIEALALGRSEKSKTLREACLSEDAVSAHRVLLETKVWDGFVNPHPARNGCSLEPPKSALSPPPQEERADLTALPAFAIDNEGSEDPDDALSITFEEGLPRLWVHIADPAASAVPNSPADIEARERGATLYLPEGVYTMLHPDALSFFALGLSEVSPALTLKISFSADNNISACDFCLSKVKITRLTYREADKLTAAAQPELLALENFANNFLKRRILNGALTLNFPEVKINIDTQKKTVDIKQEEEFNSQITVRECMLAAGEGAALWALREKIPFPYISQEVNGAVESKLFPGYAGAYQLRRTLSRRVLSTKPGLHSALGLELYTQITSPLRRYTDLLCHQQIRAVLKGAAPLDEDAVLTRLLQAEHGASQCNHAERDSRKHWTQVYLAERKGCVWDAVLLEKRKPRSTALLPALGLEIQLALLPELDALEPGDSFKVELLKADIPSMEAYWGAPPRGNGTKS